MRSTPAVVRVPGAQHCIVALTVRSRARWHRHCHTAPPAAAMVSDIRVYGADWCGLTRRLRAYLTHARFDYEYFDVDRDERAKQFVLSMNDGRRRFPMVVVEHDVVLQPSVAVLRRVLGEHAISPRQPVSSPFAPSDAR